MSAGTPETLPREAPGRGVAAVFSRMLALVLLPILSVAFVLLYALPERTDELFAWTIEPPITAMFLAAAYLGGIWFFGAAVRRSGWQATGRGMPAVLVFATLLLVATLLHLDRFHPGHVSFVTWLAVYVITPPLVVLAMVLHRRGELRAAEPSGSYLVPRAARIPLAVLGAGGLVTGVALFAQIPPLVSAWPWALTPLTAQVVGAVLTLPGMVNLALLLDPRWSAFRTIFQAQILSLAAILGALLLRRDDLVPTPATGVLVGGLILSLLAYVMAYVRFERAAAQSRRAGPPAATAGPAAPRTEQVRRR